MFLRFEGEKCHFLGKTEILPKCSMTKVLPWLHPMLLLTENYFIHQSTINRFDTAGKKTCRGHNVEKTCRGPPA